MRCRRPHLHSPALSALLGALVFFNASVAAADASCWSWRCPASRPDNQAGQRVQRDTRSLDHRTTIGWDRRRDEFEPGAAASNSPSMPRIGPHKNPIDSDPGSPFTVAAPMARR